MGQKTNPNILRVGISKKYNYKYLEKKSSELPLNDFNLLEIKKFTYKFFKNNMLQINNCNISYSHDNVLHFFISYYATPYYSKKEYENSRIKKSTQFIKQNYPNFYSNFKYSRKFKTRRIKIKKIKFFNRDFRKNYFKNERLNNYFLLNDSFTELQSKYFLNYFCDTIKIFLNKNINISIVCNQLNSNEKKKFGKNAAASLKKKVSSLFNFTRYPFYKDGINTLFLCAQRPDSTNLLTEYLACNLPKQKHHIQFLKFAMKCLSAFKRNKFSKLETIRIRVKGRLNRRPRARYRFFEVGSRQKLLPILSINSKVHFSEKTSFTANGTLGIKTWAFGRKKKPSKISSNLVAKERLKINTGKAQRKMYSTTTNFFLPLQCTKLNKAQQLNIDQATNITFGDMAIIANQSGFINKTQLEATKSAIKRILKKEGKVWQKIFPYLVVSGKTKGARMGKGKGKIKYSTCYVKKSGTILFEVTGAKILTVVKALKIGKAKLPLKTSLVRR